MPSFPYSQSVIWEGWEEISKPLGQQQESGRPTGQCVLRHRVPESPSQQLQRGKEGEGLTILFSFASLNISREGSHLGLHRTGQEQFTTHKWPAVHQTTKAKMQQELAISPLAIISLYFGALGKRWKEAGLNSVSRSAITQHEGTEPHINGSVMLKGKGLEQSPLYF